MSTLKENWTYKDFLAYLLLYAANADLEINDVEKETLFSKVNIQEFENIRIDFEKEDSHERLQTIFSFREKYFNNESSLDKLFIDLKDIFMADNKYNPTERAIFMGLRRILK